VWTNAALTGKSFDINLEGTTQGMVYQPNSKKVWLYPIQNQSTFFFDTFDVTAGSPIPLVNIYANPDGAFPIPQGVIYVSAVNKMVVWRQRWNGASYDLWLTFVNGTTGAELSHIAGLSSETHNAQFCLVEKGDLSHSYVGFLNGNAGIHFKVYLIDATSETIVATKDIGATISNSICYSCKTDSFFVRQASNLVELDRATLNIKNTYVGQAAHSGSIDYIKSTQEIWGISASDLTVDITNVSTGAYSTVTLSNQFSGWANGFPTGGRFYHESLNAFCVPGQIPGFTGNPWLYDIYDVTTRTLKKEVNLNAAFTAFCFSDWWSQGFNIPDGSIYLAAGCWQTPPNFGVVEIGTS
jgi:hypothetical protein